MFFCWLLFVVVVVDDDVLNLSFDGPNIGIGLILLNRVVRCV